MPMPFSPTVAMGAAVLGILARAGLALAAQGGAVEVGMNARPDASSEPDRPSRPEVETGPRAFRLGVLGGVGFPRPVAVEAMAKVGDVVGIGAEASFLPAFTVSGIDASAWSVAGDLSVFPFRGGLFLGARGGYQHIGASSVVDPLGTSESAALDSFYLNPRVGFLWTFRSGITLGIDAGVQIPVTTSFSTTLPESLAIVVRQNPVVQTLSGVLPSVDLLRFGVLF